MVWNYSGFSPQDMADRIVTNSERGFTVTVNDIEHQESQSLSGIAVIKIFFRPNVNIAMAVTQVTAICQTVLRGLPPGTTPPLVITYTRIVDSDRAIGPKQQDAARAAVVRPGAEVSADAVKHGAGCGHSLSLRRQAEGRYKSILTPQSFKPMAWRLRTSSTRWRRKI